MCSAMSSGVLFTSVLRLQKRCNLDVCAKRFAKTLRRGQDPEVLKKMPVFQFVGEKRKRKWRIYVWGSSMMGALGMPNLVRPVDGKRPLKAMNRPSQLSFFNHAKINDIACGYGFTLIAATNEDSNYKLFGTGMNTDSQLGYQESEDKKVLNMIIKPAPIHLPIFESNVTVVKVACGRAHTVCLTSNNELFSLGNNAYGQCGRHIVEKEIYEGSKKVNTIHGISEKVAEIICGQDHTLFLTENGSVYSCGWGADGQTGLGHFDNVGEPTRVKGDIDGEKIVALSSAGDSVLACNEKGDVFGWGNSEYSQFASVTNDYQTNIPRHLCLKNVGKVTEVACGGTMCMLLNEKGQVFVWGYGILGKGPKVDYLKEPSMLPEPLFGCNEFNSDVKVTGISATLSHFAAITNKGDLYTWGRNRDFCLGHRLKHDLFFPLRVPVPISVTKASFGVDHAVVFGYSIL